MGNDHFVYILQCNDMTLYTGYTNNLEQRLKKHETGKGAKYTRGRGPFKLLFKEAFITKEAALSREYEIKQFSREKKLELIARDKVDENSK